MSITDPPAPVDQPAHALDEVIVIRQPAMPGPVYPAMPWAGYPAPPLDNRRLRLVAAALLGIAALIRLAVLFLPVDGVRAVSDSGFDISAGLFILVLVDISGRLLSRRGRELSVGLAVGYSAVYICTNLPLFGADEWQALAGPALKWFNVAEFLAIALGGIAASALRPAATPEFGPEFGPDGLRAGRRGPWSVKRITVLLIGLIGAACYLTAKCVPWVSYSNVPMSSSGVPFGPAQVTTCCTFATSDSWEIVSGLTCFAVLFAIAVAAVLVRSRRLGAGLLIAATLAQLSRVFIGVTSGSTNPDGGSEASGSVQPGIWFLAAGLILPLVAGIIWLRRRTPTVVPWPGPWPMQAPAAAAAPAEASMATPADSPDPV